MVGQTICMLITIETCRYNVEAVWPSDVSESWQREVKIWDGGSARETAYFSLFFIRLNPVLPRWLFHQIKIRPSFSSEHSFFLLNCIRMLSPLWKGLFANCPSCFSEQNSDGNTWLRDHSTTSFSCLNAVAQVWIKKWIYLLCFLHVSFPLITDYMAHWWANKAVNSVHPKTNRAFFIGMEVVVCRKIFVWKRKGKK